MDLKKYEEKNIIIFTLTFLFSFFLGAFTFFLIDKNKPIHPDRILKQVKKEFRADGSIEGTWIEMTKVPWSKHSYSTEVYYGGLSRFENGVRQQYEFIADAYTGSLIDLYKI